MNAVALLLADGRFPSGGSVQSWGVEAACALGDVHDVATLDAFVHGRLVTQGRTDAAVAAWVCRHAATAGEVVWPELDAEVSARLASPRLRAASRTQGRQLLRAGRRVWPDATFPDIAAGHADGPHQMVALGAVAAAAGLDDHATALCAAHHLVAAATSAAVRLLGLDPFATTALAAPLAPVVDELARQATADARSATSPRALPAHVGLLADIYAEHHGTWEVRLFAS